MSGDVPGPPWQTRCTWQGANLSVRFLMDRHSEGMRPVFETAEEIGLRMAALEAIYDDLCSRTCRLCPDPCCASADVWFDLRDLLFLHATRLPLALGNPRKPENMPCWFLGAGGCTLPRRSRPWICTWYLCAVQKRRLQNRNPQRLARLQRITQDIRAYRKQLEECFIEAVRPDPVLSEIPNC